MGAMIDDSRRLGPLHAKVVGVSPIPWPTISEGAKPSHHASKFIVSDCYYNILGISSSPLFSNIIGGDEWSRSITGAIQPHPAARPMNLP